MSDAIQVVVVGYGAGKARAQVIDAVNGMRLHGVCEVDADRRNAAAADWPDRKIYADLDAVLADDHADLVVLALPHDLHAPLGVSALESGKHVVVEKPMAMTVEQCQSMIEARDASGCLLSVQHQRRWDGDFVVVRELLDEDVIGPVFYLASAWQSHRQPRTPWRQTRQSGGAQWYDLGAHMLDQFLALLRQPVRAIHAFGSYAVFHGECPSFVHAVLTFDNGVTGVLTTGCAAADSADRWLLLGERGAIRMRPFAIQEGEFTVSRIVGDDRKKETTTRPFVSRKEAVSAYYQNVADVLVGTTGARLEVTAEQAMNVIRVLEAGMQSVDSGAPISITEWSAD